MLTRGYRRSHNLELGNFDQDPYLSNSEVLPPPSQALPELAVNSVALPPAIFSNSPLTTHASSMASRGEDTTAGTSAAVVGQQSSSPSPTITQHPAPVLSIPQQSAGDKEKRPQDYKVEKFHESSILKANGSNFTTWKRRILVAFRNHKWEPYARGEVPCPNAVTDSHGYTVWRHIDSLVHAQMASNMEDSLYGEISSDYMLAAELWTAIVNRFEESSELSQTTLLTRMCTKRIQEGETMKSHVIELRRLKAEYINRGGILSAKQWHSIFVSSLEDHSFWHQMDLFADLVNDTEQLIKSLELKEVRMNAKKMMDGQSALRAQLLNQQQFKSTPTPAVPRIQRGGGLTCQNCRRTGHSVQSCYAPGGGAVHRRPDWYKVPRHMLEKERANLAEQLRAIDCQRAQLAGPIISNDPSPVDQFAPPSAKVASASFDPSIRQEILLVVDDSTPVKNPSLWLLDSGATSHMTFYKSHFVEYREISPIPIYTARDNETLYAVGYGAVSIVFEVNGKQIPAIIANVLYVPEICANLLSLAKLDDRGLEYRGRNGRLEFSNERGVIATARRVGNQWIMDSTMNGEKSQLASTQRDVNKTISVWHQRLGHVNHQRIMQIHRDESVTGLNVSDQSVEPCEACVMSKMPATPNTSRALRATSPGDIIHVDLEFMGSKSFSQADISLKFVDEYSNFVWVYALPNKQADTIASIWAKICATFLTQFSIRVKALHSDNGTEFVNNIMDKYNSQNGIEHHKTAPHRHEMNGRAERLNRTGSNAVRSMLLSANLPNAYWAEAYSTFAYIHNRTASSAIPHQTPYEVLYQKKPDVSYIRVFGCTAYMRTPPEERRKLDPKAQKAILIGYRDDAAYKLYDPITRRVYYSRDVVFDEFHTFSLHNDTPQAKIEEIVDATDDPSDLSQPVVRTSNRVSIPTKRLLEGKEQEISLSYLDRPQLSNVARERRIVAGIPIPFDAADAFNSNQSQEWLVAMQYEISKLEGMECWEVLERPQDAHVIKGLWVFNIKEEVDGSLEYRARWVARGDSQIPGLEFDDTFASTGDYVIARIVFAFSSDERSQLVTLDINSAYLHSPLEQDNLYVDYPTGFMPPLVQNPCCRLKKALYGLRQGARTWEQYLSTQLTSLGFKKCVSAPSAYVRSTNEGEIIMATHVDDLQSACKSLEGERSQNANRFKEEIGGMFNFKEKDTRTMAKVLGITVHSDEQTGTVKLSIGQRVEGMLERYGIKDAKIADSPMVVNAFTVFEKDQSEEFESPPWPYAKVIGELLWIGNTVRPDIAFAVNALARHLKKPKKCHWEAAKRVLRYLKGTKHLGIVYNVRSEGGVVGYSDSDWASDPADRKSTSGFVFMFAGGAISWKSRKQNVVATSTAEAEYLAASFATNEAKWLRNVFSEINHPANKPTVIYVDNMASISMTQNPVHQSKTKHMDLRAHHLRDEVHKKNIALCHIQGQDNPADILTKPLSPVLHKKCVRLLGMD